MNGDTEQSRRRLLQLAPALAVITTTAGCLRLDTSDESSSDGNGGSSTSDTSGDQDQSSGDDTQDSTSDQDQSSSDDTQDDTQSEPDESGSSGSSDDGEDTAGDMNEQILEQVQTFIVDNEANTYAGSIEDHTGESEVIISTGAGDNGFSFSPPAIEVNPGTTIIWEWTGEGGGHNVTPEGDTDFESFGNQEIVDEAGFTTEAIFNEPGAALYVCVPHRAQGMYGAIAVTE